jgi:hypothetical protein
MVNGTVAECILGTASGAISCTSDESLKTDIRPVERALDKLQAIRGVYFKWIRDVESKPGQDVKQYLGVIAQEVEKQFPEVVTTNPADGKKMVDYASLIAPTIEAIREQQAEIKSLRADLVRLRNLFCSEHPHHEACNR